MLVDLSTAYYNSSPQVTALLARVQDIISAAAAPERHQSVPQVSELAAASRNGQPRAIRDRLDPDDYQRLLTAARAGYCKKALAAEYGISRRSVYRLLAA
jgi:DNA invertase Pin-like site-specific DNA recombinase